MYKAIFFPACARSDAEVPVDKVLVTTDVKIKFYFHLTG